MYMYITMS